MLKKITVSITVLLPLLVNSQDLDPEIYDAFLGTYKTTDNKEFVIGRSFSRLYLFNPQTDEYRGLYPEKDAKWSSYNSILKSARSEKETTIQFKLEEQDPHIIVSRNGQSFFAKKSSEYIEEKISFESSGIELRGTLMVPNKKGKFPGILLVHGSGEQNRHGYASYIRFIADHLAKKGIAVLTYDKRGSGESEGDWRTASFQDLADDAIKGYELLGNHPKIDTNQIGLGGSSQAGWILAKVVNSKPQIPFIFCISGAGMGISAAKQNIYNNLTELQTLEADGQTLTKAEEAWNALYDYIKTSDSTYKQKLDKVVKTIKNVDYLNYFPPPSNAFSLAKKENWFQTLEVNYDPLYDWKNYKGNVYAVFGELDASTPVDRVLENLRPTLATGLNKSHNIEVYPKSSHLILEATKKSDSEFGSLKKFHPYFLSNLSNWVLQVSSYQSENVATVLSLEKKWLQAYETSDLAVMETIVDNDFLITFPNGFTQTKQMILANLSQASNCSNMSLYTSKISATEYQNVVVLRGIVTTECDMEKNGKSFQRQRYTDTYLYKNGTWKVIASHLSSY